MTLWRLGTLDLPRLSKNGCSRVGDRYTARSSYCSGTDCYLHQIETTILLDFAHHTQTPFLISRLAALHDDEHEKQSFSTLYNTPRFVVLNPYGYGRKGMRFALLISGSSSPLCLDGCKWRCDGMGCHLPGWATSSLHSSPFLLGCMVFAVVEPSRVLMMIDMWSCGLPGLALVRVI